MSLTVAVRAFLAVALALSSAGILFATWQSLATARELGDRALESAARALSASVENALRAGKSEAEVRSILSDRVVAYALIAGPDGTIRFHVNRELVGTRLPATGPNSRDRPEPPVGRTVTLGVGTPAYQYDYPLRGPDGSSETLRIVLHLGAVDRLGVQSRRLWLIVGGVLSLLAGAGLTLDRMLTRLVALRDRMERQERLSLVGQLTATLAHEIRNALWGVKGYAQWLDEKLPAESPGKADVASILQGTGRIENLVDGLLRYARDETYRLEAVRLAPLVDEAVSTAASGWAGTLTVDVAETAAAWADREKLLRVLVNGIRNALQAMSGEGRLTITGASTGGTAWIRLEDTGAGFPPEAAAKLFTPFYTTKTDGTGLGLAYSRKVLEGMKGMIQLDNGARGAILTLRLPRAKDG
ncbi:MAG: hypothetical protein HY900_09395 [Deltaproteobacteria bacterium]|nr:hypothetical protein [Deltaproteobacteria bacterium]